MYSAGYACAPPGKVTPMKKLLQIITNPFLLPLVPAVVIFLILPLHFDRYVLHVIDETFMGEGRTVRYADITNDGYSERIVTGEEETYTWLKIYDHEGVLFDQWNFRGSQEHIDFPLGPSNAVKMHPGCGKVIVIFTLVQDSLYLHVIDDLQNATPLVENRFIATVGPGRGRPDPIIRPPRAEDVFRDGHSDLMFLIASGFSLYPRRVFVYNFAEDSLLVSPESFYHIRRFKKADITGDGANEYLLTGSSYANVPPEAHDFHDHSNWIMLLDNELNHVFDPIEIPGQAKRFFTFPFEKDQGTLIGTALFRHNQNEPAILSFYDAEGELQDNKELENVFSDAFLLREEGQQLLVMVSRTQKTYVYDLDKQKFIYNHPVRTNNAYSLKDLSGNGVRELISTDQRENKLIVFRNQMKDYTTLENEINMDGRAIVSFIKRPDHHPLISLHSGDFSHIISYKRNAHYYLSWVYFTGIYAVFFLFGMATRAYQKNQLSKKQAIEKKITELQLNLVKNQLSPHFSLNAINAAIHTIKKEETGKAADYLRRFSRLHRAMVLSAEQMHRTIADEIQFTADYVELEKLRFDHAFAFDIEVADNVDQQVNIPKMILQSHAENAIKHGLSGKKGDGLLRIRIEQHHRAITIRISDNGVGREQAEKRPVNSTGKGHEMMQEYYRLYNKYYHTQITQQIRDLYDQEGRPAGTSVEILIALNHA